MAQILIRTTDEIKNSVVSKAKSLGITTNALMQLILNDWLKKEGENEK